MIKLKKLILLLAAAISIPNFAKNDVNVTAVKTSQEIIIDGLLTEEIWRHEFPVTIFIQREPDEGKEPSQKSEVRLVYDDNYLYVGANLFDTSPDSIIARLSRRDVEINTDNFLVCIDSYNDKRSGVYFGVSAAGTLIDGTIYNDSWTDASWDGVWEGKANIDEHGWTVEMRIPFSQLKFHEQDEMIWGINFQRKIARRNEKDFITFWPLNESGLASHFAKMNGLKQIKSSKRIEILPYLTTRAEYTHPSAGNPFNDGSQYIPDAGADMKMGIGSNLVLNATINPDFGQVEIDPAVINLSDVETFFSEKRPFFVEGSSIFEFGVGGANNYWGFNWPGPDFFYSRRIGRSPQGSSPDADFANYPDGTHILGAAKLSGKVDDNCSIGTIHALTVSERAEYQLNGSRAKKEVEPFTYYGIVRAQKEFEDSRQGLGFISTVASRNFSDDALRNEINKNAYTGGIDGWFFLDSSKTWVVTGWFGLSHVTGTKERITSLQRNSQHYFQRPDSKINRLDSNRTSLTGYAARVYLNKQKGNFFFNSAFGLISPQFDINDVGFLSRSDLVNMHVGGGYSWDKPNNITRYTELLLAVFRNYDYDGNIIWEGIFHSGFIRFLNYYTINWNLAYNPATINNRLTRGGPLSKNPPGYQINFYTTTDNRKDFTVGAGFFTYVQPNYGYEWQIDSEIEYRPAANLSFSLSPYYSRVNEFAQWVNCFDDPFATATFGKRYVFAKMNQHTFGAGIRMNWIFTPELSLQLYVQPLISSGEFTNFKELKKPAAHDFMNYGEEASTFNEAELIADPDGNGPAQQIQIDNPDFNFKSLRGNAVLRWEYFPGSVIYLVWTQTRSDFEDDGRFQFNRSVRRLWDIQPDNIFMLKFTYWFNM